MQNKPLKAFEKIVSDLQVKHGAIFKDHLKENQVIRDHLTAISPTEARAALEALNHFDSNSMLPFMQVVVETIRRALSAFAGVE